MKSLISFLLVAAVVLTGAAATYHRSFRKGYPVGVTTRSEPNAAVLTAPKTKTVRPKSTVVTNRVVLTKEQAEQLLKNKKYKKVK